jgi:hypothetical protein
MSEERDLVRFTGGDPLGVARDPELTVHLANAARTRFFRRKDERAFSEWGDVLLEARELLAQGPEYERWFQEHLSWHWAVRAHRELPKHEIDGIAEAAAKELRDGEQVLEQVEILLYAEPAEGEARRAGGLAQASSSGAKAIP